MPRVNIHERPSAKKKPAKGKISRIARPATPANRARRAERLLVQGKLTMKKIIERTGVEESELAQIRVRLAERGIQTKIPGAVGPPQRVVRLAAKFEALLQITGEATTRCALKAEASGGSTVTHWLSKERRGVFREARAFHGGLFWDHAVKELMPWIRSVEEEYKNITGKKFNPNISLSSALGQKPKKKKK